MFCHHQPLACSSRQIRACESWPLAVELQRRIQAMEMRCYRNILHISYKDYQRGSPCQDPAGNWTTRRLPDDCKETQTAVVWSCFPFIRSGQTHLARHSERKGGRRQGRQRKRWEDNIREWTGLEFGRSQRAVENRGKLEKTVCEIICGAPTTLAVKGLMMICFSIQGVEGEFSSTDLIFCADSYSVSVLPPCYRSGK